MRFLIGLTLMIGMTQTVTAGGDGRAVKRLQGTWKVVSIRIGSLNQKPLNDIYFLFRDKSFAFQKDGKLAGGTIRVDASEPIKQIDLKIVKSSNPDEVGSILEGIFDCQGDSLKLCFAIPGEEKRPTEFVAPVEGQRVFFLLERQGN
jgi:uncharacterized protein (TIGR03067 family)